MGRSGLPTILLLSAAALAAACGDAVAPPSEVPGVASPESAPPRAAPPEAALGSIGPPARAALPSLRRAALSTDLRIAEAAEAAIRAIDGR